MERCQGAGFQTPILRVFVALVSAYETVVQDLLDRQKTPQTRPIFCALFAHHTKPPFFPRR